MNELTKLDEPPALQAIHQDALALGFSMASDPLTGSFLRTLAASKPAGRFLELGTGTGVSTAWILDGMDDRSTLLTMDDNPAVTDIARKHLGYDPRLTIKTMDGVTFLEELHGQQFDFIFADTWPGKYTGLDLALNLLKVGGFYFIDDMLPQDNWPEGHNKKVEALLAELAGLENFVMTQMNWATGLVVMTKIKGV